MRAIARRMASGAADSCVCARRPSGTGGGNPKSQVRSIDDEPCNILGTPRRPSIRSHARRSDASAYGRAKLWRRTAAGPERRDRKWNVNAGFLFFVFRPVLGVSGSEPAPPADWTA
ncbi:Hypothetical protein CINCED_3A019396 [Cinara cedri]|uniref:Uncharacterized protein n=1 Tax=Cinara cedri TaxID=506608 RepID=A0A5E4NST2_9HEMI|nr:Hypothetical protein CINCED_3A019396 [Cinara cedri]